MSVIEIQDIILLIMHTQWKQQITWRELSSGFDVRYTWMEIRFTFHGLEPEGR